MRGVAHQETPSPEPGLDGWVPVMGGVRGVTRGNSPADKGYGGKLSGKERLCGFPAPRRAGWEDRAVTLPRYHGNRTRPSSADITSETEGNYPPRSGKVRAAASPPQLLNLAKLGDLSAATSLRKTTCRFHKIQDSHFYINTSFFVADSEPNSAIRHSSTLRTPSVAVRLPRVCEKKKLLRDPEVFSVPIAANVKSREQRLPIIHQRWRDDATDLRDQRQK
ncbi:hypothetical protein Bbelb_256290 [Branchiostoma belcheri]|nr:hypothetical protein Bbelb_256290 [Branchiostoma belcheri]